MPVSNFDLGPENRISTFPTGSIPHGITYENWIIRWWRWVLSIPAEQNPLNDKDGKYSDIKQNDPCVWFLAGTFGKTAERTCVIPLGKSILLPIINYECSFADEPKLRTEEELRNKCRAEIDIIEKADVSIDGNEFDINTLTRVQTNLFNIFLPTSNVLNITASETQMISDGYWIFINKLDRGLHRIESFGSCRNGTINIAVNYDILIDSKY